MMVALKPESDEDATIQEASAIVSALTKAA